jgi:PAS domain-containing protein
MVQEIANAPIERAGHGRRVVNFVRAPIFDAHDHVEFIISIATDVTDQRAHAEELRLASKVFETTADAVLVSDADDRVMMVNQAFTDMTGFSADEVRGHVVQELPFAAGHLDRDAQFIARLTREGRIS